MPSMITLRFGGLGGLGTSVFRGVRNRQAAAAVVCMLLAAGRGVAADTDTPAAAAQPGDISVGEPISLPVPPATGKKLAADATEGADAGRTTPVPAGGPAVPPTVVPGNGWLGLTAEESKQPGRWVVADVAANGPAAAAGIRPGDELRAINGTTLSNAEELAQSMTSFAAGQDVKLAIGRGTDVVDVVVRAAPRPPATAKPNWQPATAGATPAAPAVPSPGVTAAADAAGGFGPAAAAPSSPPSVTVPAAPPAPGVVDASSPVPGPTGGRWRTPDFTPAAPPAAAEPSRFASDPPAGRLPLPADAGSPVQASAAPPSISPAEQQAADPRSGQGRPALGVRTLPIDAGMQARFRLTQPTGAYVLGVVQDLPASRAGVPPGSVIVALGDQPVRTPADLTRLVTGGPVGRPVSLEYVLPGGEERRADVVLQPLELPLQRALVGPEPTAVPALQRAERPMTTAAQDPAADPDAVRQEVRFLRQRLERLEQWLERRPVGSGSGVR